MVDNRHSTDYDQSENSTVSDQVQTERLKQLKELKSEFNNMKKNNKKRNASLDNKTKSENGTKKKSMRQHYNTSCYCWSCGAGNHSSKDCK